MKKYILAALFLLVTFLVGRASNTAKVQAQTPSAPTAWTIVGGGPISTCSKPVGVTYVCIGTDGVIGSLNGAPPVSLFPGAAVAGIQSIIVCDAAGITCLTSTGPAVTLKIPTKVAVTVPAPTVSQATSSATLQ